MATNFYIIFIRHCFQSAGSISGLIQNPVSGVNSGRLQAKGLSIAEQFNRISGGKNFDDKRFFLISRPFFIIFTPEESMYTSSPTQKSVMDFNKSHISMLHIELYLLQIQSSFFIFDNGQSNGCFGISSTIIFIIYYNSSLKP